ncbi:uncharacterized protein [Antedon mediterranea]|uniref:uncharacterized protein n=1 Tax=Antedon mediterranea TaxID=105859 RepID=UPI003AF876C6
MDIVCKLMLLFCLVCEAFGATHIPLTLGTTTAPQTVPCNQYTYYSIEVTDPCKDLRINLDVLEGEPNLYVSRGNTKFPDEMSLAWTSYNWGSESLTISSWDPEFSIGTFYIGTHAYCGTDVPTGFTDAKFTLLVQSVETEHPSDEIVVDGKKNANISANDYTYYRFCVPTTCQYIEVKLENCIDPEECPTSYAWPELLVSRSIVNPTIKDHAWKLASIERRSVYLHPDDKEFYAGHYFIGVYGWCTPQEHCTDNSTCGPCQYAENHPYSVSVLTTDVENTCVSKGALQLCEVKDDTGASNANEYVTWLITFALFSCVLL